jgi:hypothetical protein
VADDVYIEHRHSRSYTDERRKKLCRIATAALLAKHGQKSVEIAAAACRDSRALEGIRALAAVVAERSRQVEEGLKEWRGRKVLFILPSAGGNGGCNVIYQEAMAMREMGVEVEILNFARYRDAFARNYPENAVPVIYIDNEKNIAPWLAPYDAVVATVYEARQRGI